MTTVREPYGPVPCATIAVRPAPRDLAKGTVSLPRAEPMGLVCAPTYAVLRHRLRCVATRDVLYVNWLRRAVIYVAMCSCFTSEQRAIILGLDHDPVGSFQGVRHVYPHGCVQRAADGPVVDV